MPAPPAPSPWDGSREKASRDAKTELIPPVTPATHARLVASGVGTEFWLAADRRLVIGRADAASHWMPDIDLDACHALDLGVGRRHAEVWWDHGRWYVQDLDSVNHTFVNHRVLAKSAPHPLNDADELRLGRLILKFHSA